MDPPTTVNSSKDMTKLATQLSFTPKDHYLITLLPGRRPTSALRLYIPNHGCTLFHRRHTSVHAYYSIIPMTIEMLVGPIKGWSGLKECIMREKG